MKRRLAAAAAVGLPLLIVVAFVIASGFPAAHRSALRPTPSPSSVLSPSPDAPTPSPAPVVVAAPTSPSVPPAAVRGVPAKRTAPAPPAPSTHLDSITSTSFVDDSVGFASAATVPDPRGNFDELLFRTGDGGTTWQRVTRLGQTQYAWIQFADAMHGWAEVGSVTEFTTNGGTTWAPITGTQVLSYVQMLSPTTGFGTGGSRQIFRTTNGSSWTGASLAGTTGFATALDFVNSQTGWVVVTNGQSAQVQKSSDSAASWAVVSAADVHDRSLCFSDPSHGWRMGGISSAPPLGSNKSPVYNLQGSGASTADGGATWTSLAMPAGLGQFDCLRQLDASRGWSTGIDSNQNRFVLWTTNGGQDWAVRPLPEGAATWYTVEMHADGHGWGRGTDGKRPALVRTTDGGVSWLELPPLG